jgi:uncharacterized protein (TIGR02145 family)
MLYWLKPKDHLQMKNLGSFSRLASWVLVAASFFACDPDIPEEPILPEVYLDGVYDVTRDAATVEVAVVPNGQAYACIEYACGADCNWEKDTLLRVIEGDQMQEIEFRLKNLNYASDYRYSVSVWNQAGVSKTEVLTFQTRGFRMAKVQVKAWETDLDAGVTTATIVPSDDDTTVVIAEIRALPTETWKTIRSEETFFGRDSIKLSVDLSQLSPDIEYQVRWKASNRGGEKAAVGNFETYAAVDYDGNKYHAVTIGTQTWLRENFRGTHYANGDPIPNVTSAEEWSQLSTGAYCWYNNDPKLGQEYGGIYNHPAAADSREFIEGYGVPTNRNFVALCNYLGDGVTWKAGPALTEEGTTHWKTSFGTNTSGFTALANGARSNDGRFINLLEIAAFMTVNSDDGSQVCVLEITPQSYIESNLYNRRLGAGLRLIKK